MAESFASGLELGAGALTQRGLAITGDYHMAVTAYTYYCCHEQTPWLQNRETEALSLCPGLN